MANPLPLFNKKGMIQTREYYEQFPLMGQRPGRKKSGVTARQLPSGVMELVGYDPTVGVTEVSDLFDNDFEAGNLTEWTGSVTDNGTAVASTSANKNGTYGGRLTYDGVDGDLNLYETLGGYEDDVYARAWFRFSSGFTIGAAWKQFRIIGISETATSTPLVALCLQQDGVDSFSWKIQVNYTPFTGTNSSYGSLDTNWKRLELHYHNNGGTGDDVARAKIYDYDDTPIWDSGDFTHESTSHDIDTVWFGGLGHTGFPANGDYIDMDECAAGTIGWLGDV